MCPGPNGSVKSKTKYAIHFSLDRPTVSGKCYDTGERQISVEVREIVGSKVHAVG